MKEAVLAILGLAAVVSAFPTSYNFVEPQNRQFFYYNQPSNNHLIRRNYDYPPYNEVPYGPINYNSRYAYGNAYDPAYFNNNQFGYALPNYAYRQPYYGGYEDPSAPHELRQKPQDVVRKDEIDLSSFKLHHQHHPNKDRVGLKPGHDGGLHGVSFGNDGYGH